MRVHLAYGRDGLEVEVPEHSKVVVPRHRPALEDPSLALRSALQNPIESPPLRRLAKAGQRVAISVCDITRAQPRQPVIEAVLAELDGIVRPEDILILIATGTHRANTREELREMLGADIVSTLQIVNHDARDRSSLVDLGVVGDGVPLWLNRHWVEADLRITTGFVEPHFFAGFSGGPRPKMVAPGLAGLDTVLTLHDAARVGHPKAIWGVTEDNPLHTDIRACAAHRGALPQFALDVLLDSRQRIVEVYAGALFAMHQSACRAAKATAMLPVAEPFDVVLTTNSGYPLDQNLYQAVKGMSAAAQVVRPGGTVICAAECSDGLPDHGLYAESLRRAGSLDEVLGEIENRTVPLPDQWQVQVQAMIGQKARLKVHTSGLSAEQLRAAHFEPAEDLAETIADSLDSAGPRASLCVLPEGPQTIPYLDSAN